MLITHATADLLIGGMTIAYVIIATIGIWLGVRIFRRDDFRLNMSWYLMLGAWGVMLMLKLSMEYVEENRAPEPEPAAAAPAQVTPPVAPPGSSAQCCTCAFVEQEGMSYDIAPRRER